MPALMQHIFVMLFADPFMHHTGQKDMTKKSDAPSKVT
jgi:hypothetical protein